MAQGYICHRPRCSLAGLRTAALGLLPLLLARWVGWVTPVHQTHGVWFVFSCPPAALHERCPGPLGSCSPVCSPGALCCVCRVMCHLAPVHRCAGSLRCVMCVVSWATWLLFTGLLVRCVVLRVCCTGRLGSCSPVRTLGVLCCVCGVLGHLAPVHQCARLVLVFCARCCGQLGSCSPVCSPDVLCCVCRVLCHLAPVHRSAGSLRCVMCVVTWATLLLFTGLLVRCVVLRVCCTGRLGSCSPVRTLGVLCCVCGVLGHLAPVHQCARSVLVLRARCCGQLGSCSPVCPPMVLCCVRGVLGCTVPVHRSARSVRSVAGAVSSATWLLFTGVPARCVAL